ncbi:hypothetical protein ENUP19_0113G0006 [Entamoeba nuttalli]|uniref:Protein kinase domain-containing protein n=2 Tax=Entamoeba nuttalli TaxID=412467 RepID=A0ABQ0DIB6_9EUKA
MIKSPKRCLPPFEEYQKGLPKYVPFAYDPDALKRLPFGYIELINNCPSQPMLYYNPRYSMYKKTMKNFLAKFPQKKQIGRGSFWDVYCVRDPDDGILKVVKVSIQPQMAGVYENEFANIEATKNCEYIIQCIYTQRIDHMYFIMMDLMKGSIWDLLHQRPMEFFEIIYVTGTVLRGLRELHRLGLAHMDVKPENIFVLNDGRVKLGDLNSCRKIGESLSLDDIGEASYCAPEVIGGQASQLADVFSLGITVFEMDTRRKFPNYEQNFYFTDPILLKLFRFEELKQMYLFMTVTQPCYRVTVDQLLSMSIFENPDAKVFPSVL